MTKVRPLLILLSIALGTQLLVSCQSVNAKSAISLTQLTGVWEGTYEYLDYQGDAARIQLPSTIVITVTSAKEGAGPAEARLAIVNSEPGGADVTDEVLLRYFPTESLVEFDGTWAVTEAAEDKQNAFLRLVFTGAGDDDGRPALVRQTIERLGDSLVLRRDVRYDDVDEFIIRSEYLLRQAN